MISEAVGLSNVREHTHLILVPAFFISALVLAFGTCWGTSLRMCCRHGGGDPRYNPPAMEGRLEHVDQEYIRNHIAEAWGWPVVTVVRSYTEGDSLHGLVWRDEWGDSGVDHVVHRGEWAEIGWTPTSRGGISGGGSSMGRWRSCRSGVRTVSVTTTNDNLRALTFYVRRGFRLVKLDLDGMERVRAAEAGGAAGGAEAIPLRDMLELEKELV